MTGGTVITAGSQVTIPFAFNYFGSTYNRLWVSHEGTIRLGNSGGTTPADPGAINPDLTRTPGTGDAARPAAPVIAPLWDDLSPISTENLRRRQHDFDGDGQSDLALEWRNYWYASISHSVSETVNFQVILYADGKVQFNYGKLDLPTLNAASGGVAATVGLWSGSADNVALAAGKYVPGPHSIFGSINDAEGGPAETNDRYIRLAWDTGGAAWDLGAIDGVDVPSTALEATRIALRDAFLDSLGNQIERRSKAGQVFQEEIVVAAFNFGGGALPLEGFSADPLTTGTTFTSATPVNTSSDSIPLAPGSSNKVEDVFESGRRTTGFSITTLPQGGTLQDGTYIIELMFATPSVSPSVDNSFHLVVEGKRLLVGYQTTADRAKIVRPSDSGGDPLGEQYFTAVAGLNTGVVKRFQVDVTGGGLNISLQRSDSAARAISGLRILKAPPPRVENVIVKGSTWEPGIEYSFDEIVGLGQQLRPIPTQNANTIEIHFDGPVTLSQGALQLAKTIRDTSDPLNPNKAPIPLIVQGTSATNYVYDPVNYVARWTFPATGDNSLQDGKYAIMLDVDGVTGGGRKLDGDWGNGFGFAPGDVAQKPTADKFGDDGSKPFIVGDGMEGSATGYFRLNFALLAGDYNGDGAVNTAGPAVDTIVAGDRWSDGNGDGAVDPSGGELDAGVRTANANDFLPLRQVHGADFRDDEVIDGGDLQVWRAMFGFGADADFDGDGDSDGADFLYWQRLLGSKSAWAQQLSGFAGSAASVFGASSTVVGAAGPRVMNVIVSGSQSYQPSHMPFAFDTVDGSGQQLQTVPVGGADTISIVFSENVNVSAESLIVFGMTTFNLPELAAFSYDAATYTATWRYEGWALGDNYLLALSDSVTDVDDGNWLDGEWTNPGSITTVNAAVSEFPSGDGTPGGWFKFVMTLLPGDADLNGAVDLADYNIWLSLRGADGGFQDGDFAGDGMVGDDGFAIWQDRYGMNLQTLQFRADFNGDFKVDAVDLDRIADNAGMTGATWVDGDLNGDGEVTLADLDLALAQYGWGISVAS